MGTDFTGKMNFGPGLAVDFPKTARGLKIKGVRYCKVRQNINEC
jgi:hypothetical protein